jgi:hypothetical protein
MGTNVHDVLEAARSLPAHEQLEILQGLAQSLAQAFSPLDSASAAFWQQRSLDTIATEHAIPVITDIRDLAIADWPDDEAPDDLIAYLRTSRGADRIH